MSPVLLLQWLFYTAGFLWRITTKVTYNGVDHLDLRERPFILASNHQSKADPFLLSFLPMKTVKKLIPLRFPTTSLYFDRILYRSVISPLGSFRMDRWSTSLDEYLKESVTILNDGGAILFFPEGRIARSEDDHVAKPGIAYLAKKSHAPVIPLHIEQVSKGGLFRRSVIKLSLGRAITLSDDDFSKESLTRDSQKILDTIYSL